MSDRLNDLLARAVAAGLLPADATRPAAGDVRPWPVVVLTAIGAWLASLPLLGVVMLFLGDLLLRGVGPYLAGVPLLLGAVLLLRAAVLPLFVEQLAIPMLFVGFSSLGMGLFNDLPDRAAAGTLAVLALGLALPLTRAWLRVLLGAVAALALGHALLPDSAWRFDDFRGSVWWLAVHGLVLLWLVGLWAQERLFADGRAAAVAAALESLAVGWLLVALSGLAFLSGMTFLVGGALGSGLVGEIAGELAHGDARIVHPVWLHAASAALALGAVLVTAHVWPAVRQAAVLGVAVVAVVLAWFLPMLGAALLVLAVTATTRRNHLATAAALAAAWIIGAFYYLLQWSLASKALLLVAAGALLGAVAWFALRRGAPAARTAAEPVSPWWPRGQAQLLVAVSAVLTLLLANIGIWQKERLIAEGQPVFVELAPVDPRSLMQGDFMRLNFRLPADGEFDHLVTFERPKVVARRDARGVASLLRLHAPGVPLATGEFLIELTPKNGRWTLVSDAWYFKEGQAERWAQAKYGEFRVAEDGRALLVGMADARLQAIVP